MRFALVALVSVAASAQTLTINGAANWLASQPSFAAHADGTQTFVWNAYRLGRDKIFGVTERGGRLSRPLLLSPGGGVYYHPVVVSNGWVFWSRQVNGRWQIVGRCQRDGRWDPLVVLSGASHNGLAPTAVDFGNGVALAWEDHSAQPQRIMVRVWDGKSWSSARAVSEQRAYRPALAATRSGELWAFWDAYVDERYVVYGRQVEPRLGDVQRLSKPGRDCLKATATAFDGGIGVAWVSRVELIGGEGALDHWDRVQATVVGSGNVEDVADLRHGLLSDIEPKPGPIWGYSGRRRHPMLASDGDGVWLLWERRTIPDGRSDETGQLCGRRFDGRQWSEQVLLWDGLVDYRLATGAGAEDGRLPVVAKDIHHYYQTFEADLRAGVPIESREWPGWKTVELPLRENGPRRSVNIDGQEYHLYWGDLHVHSELTPDAEGEVDELMHFARDRVQLDVVVMQENDSNSWLKSNPQGAYRDHMLTEAEYALSVYFSRRYTEPGRFVALPGFEWSQRTDDNKPNHRTVIYAGEDTPLVRHPENGNDFNELCEVAEAAGGLMNSQHEAFRLVDRPCDANIEVASGWGAFIMRHPDKFHADLSAGFNVGFVATSDGHRRNPGTGGGLTAIYARELTPEAVMEALREHRVYATNGSRIFMDARANGVFMGQDVEASGEVNLTLKVATPRPLVRAVLVRDGDEIHVVEGRRRTEAEISFADRPGSGFHWYYWRVEQEGTSPHYPANLKVAEGHWAWSSPHRVTLGK